MSKSISWVYFIDVWTQLESGKEYKWFSFCDNHISIKIWFGDSGIFYNSHLGDACANNLWIKWETATYFSSKVWNTGCLIISLDSKRLFKNIDCRIH